jgi:putative chitinase
MLTPDLIKELAPRARADYVQALTSDRGWQVLEKYKITKELQQLAGFLANCLHETGGFTILRESLNYKTPNRLRQVWPSRFGKKSDAELLKICNNEKALASIVYNGRMGNRPGTDDGYVFRGAGYLQTTGREDFIRYGKLADIDFSVDPPPSTDDADALLLMSAAEWANGKCNELCSTGNFAGACAVINVGSPSKVGSVVELGERQKWFKLVMRKFGEYENILESPIPPATTAAPVPTAPTAGAPAPGESAPQAGGAPASDSADSAATPNRSPGPARPKLRRRSVSRAPEAHHWYDGIARWLGFGEKPLELPLVLANPELADYASDAGNPRYRHVTDTMD